MQSVIFAQDRFLKFLLQNSRRHAKMLLRLADKILLSSYFSLFFSLLELVIFCS